MPDDPTTTPPAAAPTVVTTVVAPAAPEPPAPPAPEPPTTPPAPDPASVELGRAIEALNTATATLPERIATAVDGSVQPLRAGLSALTDRVAAIEQLDADDDDDDVTAVTPDVPPPPQAPPPPAQSRSWAHRLMFG